MINVDVDDNVYCLVAPGRETRFRIPEPYSSVHLHTPDHNAAAPFLIIVIKSAPSDSYPAIQGIQGGLLALIRRK